MGRILNDLVKIEGASSEAGLCVDGVCALPPSTPSPPATKDGEASAPENQTHDPLQTERPPLQEAKPAALKP